MSAFLMFGSYSSEALREISEQRTRQVMEMARQFGGNITAMYALLGAFDLVLIADFPTNESAVHFSTVASQVLGISFSTMPAIPVEEFLRVVGRV